MICIGVNSQRLMLKEKKSVEFAWRSTAKLFLPNCNHSLCLKCFRDWRGRSQSCPFCRDSLKRVNFGDLWMLLICP
ncbi:hypothetical protein K2173_007652 [Erythroxylum novogranatense]|uniref:RING-type domain-containing protein n=1 Tax=Erythroxylum novogranatense TaxID=1862640 RepID=A0AAV8TS17_9ROSI|nr:hypothetical protein K2173_007652 [Erythroxylum novogranatense]